MLNYTVQYDSAWDKALDQEQSYLPNESPEGALEFFLADNGIKPWEGDLAIVTDQEAGVTYRFDAEIDEITGKVSFVEVGMLA